MNDTQPTAGQQHAAELIAGLRALADMFDAYPDLAERTRYCSSTMVVPVDDKHEVAAFIRAAKAHGAAITKSASDSSKYFSALCGFGPVTLDVVRWECRPLLAEDEPAAVQ